MRVAVFVLSCLCNVARASEAAPLEKVTTMLTDLRDKVSAEGEEEAKTYDAFACFCKTNMEAKSNAITDGKTEKDSLEAKINADSTTRDEEDVKIGEKSKEITDLEEEIEKARSERKTERLTYGKNEVDLTAGIQALESAIQAMKAAKQGVGFAQLPANAQEALVMAQSLIPDNGHHSKALTAFISEDAPNDAYAFHGDDVITTLEGLRTDFRTKKEELDKAEVDAKSSFDTLVQNKEQAIKDAQEALDTSKSDKAKATSRIATASKDLTTVSSTLLDDQTFLAELSSKCGEKATLWDKRSQTRANELSALTSAITLIKSLSEDDASFIQTRDVRAVQSSAPASVKVAAQPRQIVTSFAHAVPVKPHTQLLVKKQQQQKQLVASSAAVATQLGGRRARVMTLLKQQAQVLKSAALAALVAQAAEDPFAKVKKLVQDLIERLLKEAAEEASHKGWCDKEYALSEMKRDKSSSEIKEANGLLELSEARRGKLAEEIKELEADIKDLDETLANATTLREKEKTTNEATIKEAKESAATVEQAMDILDKYYKTTQNDAEAAFVQIKKSANTTEIPDAGFDSAYAGQQEGAVGVLGMLDVVKSDFERTVKETEAAEEHAQQAFLELETSSGESKAKKSEALKATTSAKSEADGDDSANREKLKSSQTVLDKVIGELNALDKACRLGGMTAEERKIQRDEEIDALKKALCILDSHGINSADTC